MLRRRERKHHRIDDETRIAFIRAMRARGGDGETLRGGGIAPAKPWQDAGELSRQRQRICDGATQGFEALRQAQRRRREATLSL